MLLILRKNAISLLSINPLNLSPIKAQSNIFGSFYLSSFYITCVCSTSNNMEEEKKNAGKYLSEILENDENNLKILLNQWKLVDKKLLFKFMLWSLR